MNASSTTTFVHSTSDERYSYHSFLAIFVERGRYVLAQRWDGDTEDAIKECRRASRHRNCTGVSLHRLDPVLRLVTTVAIFRPGTESVYPTELKEWDEFSDAAQEEFQRMAREEVQS